MVRWVKHPAADGRCTVRLDCSAWRRTPHAVGSHRAPLDKFAACRVICSPTPGHPTAQVLLDELCSLSSEGASFHTAQDIPSGGRSALPGGTYSPATLTPGRAGGSGLCPAAAEGEAEVTSPFTARARHLRATDAAELQQPQPQAQEGRLARPYGAESAHSGSGADHRHAEPDLRIKSSGVSGHSANAALHQLPLEILMELLALLEPRDW